MLDHARPRSLLVPVLFVFVLFIFPGYANAGQAARDVVDQTGLPLPGATVQLLRGPDVVTT